jgi:hypothetical protein
LDTSALCGLRRQSDACRKEAKASLKWRSTAVSATLNILQQLSGGRLA